MLGHPGSHSPEDAGQRLYKLFHTIDLRNTAIVFDITSILDILYIAHLHFYILSPVLAPGTHLT